MINKKETISIIGITIILALAFNLRVFVPRIFIYTLISLFLVIIINIAAKKISSYYLESEIEMDLWKIKRYGLLGVATTGIKHPDREFKHAFPAGIFIPIITAALSIGYFIWMACFTFNVKAKIYRAAKRHGLYSFSEMTEYHIGLIAASGIVANLLFAVLGYFAGFDLFTKLNIYYAFFNIIPLSDLDGNKIYFGSIIIWSFLASIVLIALAYAFLVV
ncbi:MAG: hypothetical protein Q8P15_04150 [Nanoarchaeota archaeon]|nr:hypothetical protein [Nanoarchaeota archaeon]